MRPSLSTEAIRTDVLCCSVVLARDRIVIMIKIKDVAIIVVVYRSEYPTVNTLCITCSMKSYITRPRCCTPSFCYARYSILKLTASTSELYVTSCYDIQKEARF